MCVMCYIYKTNVLPYNGCIQQQKTINKPKCIQSGLRHLTTNKKEDTKNKKK